MLCKMDNLSMDAEPGRPCQTDIFNILFFITLEIEHE